MSSLPRRRMRAPPCRCCRAAAIGTSPEGRGGQAVVKQPGRAHILAMTRQDIIPSNSDAQAPGALERNRARVERGFWPKLKRSVGRAEEHTSELQPLMRISSAVFSLKKKNSTH